MKYLIVLAIPSLLAAANPLSPREEEGQVMLDNDKLLNLGASFCLNYTMPGCDEAIQSCQADESQVDEDCILIEYPDCIEDQSSDCFQGVEQCLSDYGDEEDADQAVESCIIEDLFSESEQEKQPSRGGDDDLSTNEIPHGEEAPYSSADPEQAAVCRKASAEYEVAILKDDCKDVDDVEEGVDKRSESSACKEARATFEEVWMKEDCDAAIRPQK
ncbi:hypothetical protein ARSEF4850_010163 [Beauveria asiatica]